ncbi:MAG: hypothetical protein ACFFCW_35660, partial [Candidatus Hodarchaeota archaeon]
VDTPLNRLFYRFALEFLTKSEMSESSLFQLAKDAHLGPVCVTRGRNCLSRCIRAEWRVTLGI